MTYTTCHYIESVWGYTQARVSFYIEIMTDESVYPAMEERRTLRCRLLGCRYDYTEECTRCGRENPSVTEARRLENNQ